MYCIVGEAAEHSDSDTEESEFVPDTDNSDDDEGEDDDNSDHSGSNDDDDDMENLLFELSDVSNFWPQTPLDFNSLPCLCGCEINTERMYI